MKSQMKRMATTTLCAAALMAAPVSGGVSEAQAGNSNIIKGIIGGVIAGAVIGSIVRAGQNHCHGSACHAHGYARAGHYHDAYGNIIYQAPPQTVIVAPPPPPPPAYSGSYPQAHYDWCFGKYRSYHAQSNSYQPYGYSGRRQCISPYM
ncbi:MAG: BA14K family protein [Nitratireductor sp.]|nr:BA14K family protein [Nitratireductor sp.]MCB1458265.1 BA14K family protein [Nitratireductor sp.]